MPVIINDFEVVVEPAVQDESRRRRTGDEGGQAAAPALRPEDIERIIRHYRERYRRLLAD